MAGKTSGNKAKAAAQAPLPDTATNGNTGVGDPGDMDLSDIFGDSTPEKENNAPTNGSALSEQAQNELAKLAGVQEGKARPPGGVEGAKRPPTDLAAKVAAKRAGAPSGSAPTAEASSSGETSDGTPSSDGATEVDGIPLEGDIPGLTTAPAAIDPNHPDGTPKSSVELLAEAKARPGGKAKAKKGTKAKAKGKRTQTEEQKARAEAKAAEKKEKDKQAKAEKTEREKKRKADLAAKKAEAAKARALSLVPGVLSKESKGVQAAFAEEYKVAGPKTDRNPNGTGLRRAKADRGDVASGFVMALRLMKRLQAQKAEATG